MSLAKTLIEEFFKTRIGGTRDTLACLGLLGAGLGAATPLANHLSPAVPALVAMLGAMHFGARFTGPLEAKAVLPSNIDQASDVTPHQVDRSRWNGFLIGYSTDTGQPVYLDDENAMRHILVVGMTGVGKTVLGLSLMYQQIMRGGGVLFIDGKIDSKEIANVWYFANMAGRGNDLRVINPGNPRLSHKYNPLMDGDADEVASRVLSIIPSTENNPGADHYRQEANTGLSIIVGALQRAGLAYTMIDVSILLMSAAAMQELERMLAHSRDGRDSTELKNYRLFLDKFRAPDPRTGLMTMNIAKLKDTFGGIGGRLFQFGTGNFGAVMNTYSPDVRLYDAIRQRLIVYVALPTMGKTEVARNFGKLLIGDYRTAISWIQALPEHERPNPPQLVWMDETGSFATQALSVPFEQGRSARQILAASMQTEANLSAVSEEFSEMVRGNTWTRIYFKIGNQETALAAAEAIGQEIGVLRSLSDSESISANLSILRHTPEGSTGTSAGLSFGEREQEQYRVTADELKELDKGEVIMTYGSAQRYSLRIPMLTVSEETKARFGPVRLKRLPPTGTKPGADFAVNPDRFLQTNAT